LSRTKCGFSSKSSGVTGERQLRKRNNVRANGSGAGDKVEHQIGVARKIADCWIDLGECYSDGVHGERSLFSIFYFLFAILDLRFNFPSLTFGRIKWQIENRK
jgi:hypothetical protein